MYIKVRCEFDYRRALCGSILETRQLLDFSNKKRLMGISNVKSPIWALLQHPKPLQKLDYKV